LTATTRTGAEAKNYPTTLERRSAYSLISTGSRPSLFGGGCMSGVGPDQTILDLQRRLKCQACNGVGGLSAALWARSKPCKGQSGALGIRALDQIGGTRNCVPILAKASLEPSLRAPTIK
jgi:hypothetical protein